MEESTDRDQISGLEPRYVLTDLLMQRGSMKVAELTAALDRAGFVLRGRPTKVVSDALRWEIARGRVIRQGWGTYGPGRIPSSTSSRIRHRIAARKVATTWASGCIEPSRILEM